MKAKSLHHHQVELEPHERLLAKVIKLAISDAKQTKRTKMQQEALDFLWHCTPVIAERLALPVPPHRTS